MGAWGEGILDNDAALDWLGDLEEQGDEFTVRDALEAAADAPPDEYLDADEGQEALVAAEVVAAAAGRPADAGGTYGRLRAWAQAHPDVAELVGLARQAVERANAAESEIRELWLEADETGEGGWFQAVRDLRNRLAAAAGYD